MLGNGRELGDDGPNEIGERGGDLDVGGYWSERGSTAPATALSSTGCCGSSGGSRTGKWHVAFEWGGGGALGLAPAGELPAELKPVLREYRDVYREVRRWFSVARSAERRLPSLRQRPFRANP